MPKLPQRINDYIREVARRIGNYSANDRKPSQLLYDRMTPFYRHAPNVFDAVEPRAFSDYFDRAFSNPYHAQSTGSQLTLFPRSQLKRVTPLDAYEQYYQFLERPRARRLKEYAEEMGSEEAARVAVMLEEAQAGPRAARLLDNLGGMGPVDMLPTLDISNTYYATPGRTVVYKPSGIGLGQYLIDNPYEDLVPLVLRSAGIPDMSARYKDLPEDLFFYDNLTSPLEKAALFPHGTWKSGGRIP